MPQKFRSTLPFLFCSLLLAGCGGPEVPNAVISSSASNAASSSKPSENPYSTLENAYMRASLCVRNDKEFEFEEQIELYDKSLLLKGDLDQILLDIGILSINISKDLKDVSEATNENELDEYVGEYRLLGEEILKSRLQISNMSRQQILELNDSWSILRQKSFITCDELDAKIN